MKTWELATRHEDWLTQVRDAIPQGCSISETNGTSLIHDEAGWLVGATLGDDGAAQRRAHLIVSLPLLLDAIEKAIRERDTGALCEALQEVRARIETCRTQ